MKRRALAEGTIFKRNSNGRWAAAANVDYRNERRVRKYVYGDTQAEVRARR